MRPIAKALAVLAAASVTAVSPICPAWAAQGTLSLSGNYYVNPTVGCYNTAGRPLAVSNGTDTPVQMFSDSNCRAKSLGVVQPGSTIFAEGGSVYVPR
ncbi:hypothetical protein ACFOY2_01530 [Nonomuraea purpurea]|uniref:Uncharacterized protein n=1 Tax=Nonomuraea purpurea TaxID=1849276 RepID=A0ABV8FYF7_9ACTN